MTIQLAYRQLLAQLYHVYDNREAANIADMVIEHVTGQSKIDRIVYKDLFVPTEQQEALKKITSELLNHKPVQYVLGKAGFMNFVLHVNEQVLIPRPETEELVQWVLNDRKTTNSAISILDVGTGSGCIAIGLAKSIINAGVTAIDISQGAVEVARHNAANNQAAVEFIVLDFLNEARWSNLGNYDVLVSNPPYIAKHEAEDMLKNVLLFEPHTALFVPDNDALLFYRKIAAFAEKKVTGSVYVEFNERLGSATLALFNHYGFETELKKDMQGKDRMLKAWKNTQRSW